MQINKMIVTAIIFFARNNFWNVYKKVILFWFNMHEGKIIIVASCNAMGRNAYCAGSCSSSYSSQEDR